VIGDGAGAAAIADGARDANMAPDAIIPVADREAALTRLLADLRPGDVVLVKASRGIALDLLVDELRAALSDASTTGR
jgi:UDP-N-acetylmuramoyl-tripeptide--D-alanyl-D-alanine ligase